MPIWEEFRSLCRQNEEKWTDLRSIVANQHSFGTNNNHQSCYCYSSLFCFIKPIFFNWHMEGALVLFLHIIYHALCILMMEFCQKIFMCAKKYSACLKITEKVSFNITSKVYIFSGQKLSKSAKNSQFWKLEACGQTVLPDRSILIGQKIVGKWQNWKILMRHLK